MIIIIDTDALNSLTGISDEDIKRINELLSLSGSKILVTHIQVDERYDHLKEYNEKIVQIQRELNERGLNIDITPSLVSVIGQSRIGLAKIGSDVLHQIYEELKVEIQTCEKEKKEEKNVTRDSIIGVSAFNKDVFITGDKCLKRSLDKLIDKFSDLLIEYNIPVIIRRTPRTKNIVDEIIKQLEK